MEIKTSEIQSLTPVIITNYEELKKELTEKTDLYKNMVYSEENVKEAKADRANLNKLEKAINDEKIRVKNLFLKPYEDFENKCKELMQLVKDASNNIDVQVKAFESKQDEEKKKHITDIFNGYVGDFKDLIKIETVFNDRWLNKTYTLKKVEEDINHIFSKIRMDIATIEGQIDDDEKLLIRIKDYYFQNLDKVEVLSLALNEKNRVIESQKNIENLKSSAETSTEKEAISADSAEKLVLDFRVTVSKEQMVKLKNFLKENNIKYEKVPSDVDFYLDELQEYVEDCREDGDTDARSILYYIEELRARNREGK